MTADPVNTAIAQAKELMDIAYKSMQVCNVFYASTRETYAFDEVKKAGNEAGALAKRLLSVVGKDAP